jgi:hypothetical protein
MGNDIIANLMKLNLYTERMVTAMPRFKEIFGR